MKTELEEAAERLQKDKYGIFISKEADVKGQLVIDTANAAFLSGMNEGAKWMQERMYSEEEVLNILGKYNNHIQENFDPSKTILPIREWFEQFKKK